MPLHHKFLDSYSQEKIKKVRKKSQRKSKKGRISENWNSEQHHP